MNHSEEQLQVESEMVGALADIHHKAIENNRHPMKGPFSSPHSALGVITEEFWEFVGAVRSNDRRQLQKEALDIAAACVCILAQWKLEDRVYSAQAQQLMLEGKA